MQKTETPNKMTEDTKWLSQYTLLKKLGEGTYGKVYRAKHIQTNKESAIKIITTTGQEGITATTLRELVLMKKLQNKQNLINMFDYKILENKIYMVLDYIPKDLKSLYLNKDLSYNEIRLIIFQVIRGVDELHKTCMMHRDLKPQNILVTNDLKVKIIDYGLARNYSIPCRPYTKEILTQYYRPHEILLGSNEYGLGVDMWSIGCILVELFIKKPFFDGNSEIEMCYKIFK